MRHRVPGTVLPDHANWVRNNWNKAKKTYQSHPNPQPEYKTVLEKAAPFMLPILATQYDVEEFKGASRMDWHDVS